MLVGVLWFLGRTSRKQAFAKHPWQSGESEGSLWHRRDTREEAHRQQGRTEDPRFPLRDESGDQFQSSPPPPSGVTLSPYVIAQDTSAEIKLRLGLLSSNEVRKQRPQHPSVTHQNTPATAL